MQIADDADQAGMAGMAGLGGFVGPGTWRAQVMVTVGYVQYAIVMLLKEIFTISS